MAWLPEPEASKIGPPGFRSMFCAFVEDVFFFNVGAKKSTTPSAWSEDLGVLIRVVFFKLALVKSSTASFWTIITIWHKNIVEEAAFFEKDSPFFAWLRCFMGQTRPNESNASSTA